MTINKKELLRKVKGNRDLEEEEEISLNEILLYMYCTDKDLPLKSRVYRPKNLSAFSTLRKFLKVKECYGDVPMIMKTFYVKYLALMVSHEGRGRDEIFKTISSLFDKETIRMTLGEKLTTNMR